MAITTVSSHVVSVNAIQGTLIADNAITAVHIATNAVSGTLIADNAVTATHIAQNTITVTQIADDAIEAAKLADGIITTNHLNKAMISSQTEVTPVAGDFVLIGDTSDSNNLKKAPISGITALVSSGAALDDITTGDAASTLATSSGNITIDSPADIILDADSDSIKFKDGGTEYGKIYGSNNNFYFNATQSNKNMRFVGDDGGSSITALELDMADAGKATFNSSLLVGNTDATAQISSGGSNVHLTVTANGTDGAVIFKTGGTNGDPSSTSERMRIHASGCVGVGTTADRSLGTNIGTLVVNGSAGGGLWLSPGDSSAMSSKIYAQANGSVGDLIINNGGSNPGGIMFQMNASEKMRIQSNGRVGIGTTGGNAGLHVANGDVRTTSAAFANDANSMSMSQESSGGVICARGPDTSTRGTITLSVNRSNGGGALAGITVNNDGSVSKYSGSFKIDHPLEAKKDTNYLVHSFVEAPQADNIYRGVVKLVNGTATINLDTVSGMTEGTYVLLNTNTSCFTSNETDWDAVKGSVTGNILTINCQNTSSTATVSWLVIGERHDQHMKDANWTDASGRIIVEPVKKETFKLDLEG